MLKIRCINSLKYFKCAYNSNLFHNSAGGKFNLISNNFLFPCYRRKTFYRHNVTYNKKLECSQNESEICRAYMYFRCMRLLKVAVKESGPIIESNKKLSDAIEKAKQVDLPSNYIDYALKISCDLRANVGLFDFQHSSGCHFVIQYEDIDATVTKHHLLEMSQKYDTTLHQHSVKWPAVFEQKGIITVMCDSPEVERSGIQTLASKVKADNIHKVTDFDGTTYFKFYCEPWLLHEVKDEVSKVANSIEETYVGFVPKKVITLNQNTLKILYSIISDLKKVPTIDNVYDNVNITELIYKK